MKRILFCITLTLLLGLGVPARAGVTGQWDFNGDFSAAIGTAHRAAGNGGFQSVFGTDHALGVPDIGGVVAQVMRFPAMPSAQTATRCSLARPPTAATRRRCESGIRLSWTCSIQSALRQLTVPCSRPLPRNANDADLFIGDNTVLPQPNGIGSRGVYNGTLRPTPGIGSPWSWTWTQRRGRRPVRKLHRRKPCRISQELRDTRLAPSVAGSSSPSWIFSDNDGETAVGYVNSVQFSDYAMTAAEIAFLGGPTAGGIAVIPEPASGLLLGAGLLLLARRVLRRTQ